jgi:hypothetical protein
MNGFVGRRLKAEAHLLVRPGAHRLLRLRMLKQAQTSAVTGRPAAFGPLARRPGRMMPESGMHPERARSLLSERGPWQNRVVMQVVR